MNHGDTIICTLKVAMSGEVGLSCVILCISCVDTISKAIVETSPSIRENIFRKIEDGSGLAKEEGWVERGLTGAGIAIYTHSSFGGNFM